MIAVMPTHNLVLKKRAKSGRMYYFTSWTDIRGERHEEYFGSSKRQADIDFGIFHNRWRNNPSVKCPTDVAVMTLVNAYALFQQHAKAHYIHADDGKQTGKAKGFDNAMRPMLDLFGDVRLSAMTAQHLGGVRDEMVKRGWSVGTINERVRLTRQVWRWFTNKGHADAGVWYGMKAIEPLAIGRGVVVDGETFYPPEGEEILPVPDADLLAVIYHVVPTIRDMIYTQMMTGMRPTETCIMRPMDIDTTGSIWLYVPRRHKMSHKKKSRRIAIGPRVQDIIRPYLSRRLNIADPIFSQREAFTESCDARRAAFDATARKGDYRKAASYQARERTSRGNLEFDRTRYAKHISRACEATGANLWSPNQLRHNAATNIRKRFGLEAAQAVLGHAKADTTEIYAQIGMERAVAAMEAVG
jgi:integrase